MVSYLSSNAKIFVQTRGASLAGDDSRVRFLLVHAMVEEAGLARNSIIFQFTYRKIDCYLVVSLVALGHMTQASWALDLIRGRANGIHVVVERLGVGQDEGTRKDANCCKKT